MQISKKCITFLFIIFFMSFSCAIFSMRQVKQDTFSDTPEDTFEVVGSVDLITMLPEKTSENGDFIGFEKWALSACGRYLVAAGKEWEKYSCDDIKITEKDLVEVYDFQEKEKILSLKFKEISCLDISEGGKYIVIGNKAGEVGVFGMEAEKMVFQYKHNNKVKVVQFTDNGRFLVSACCIRVKVYDIKDKDKLLFNKKIKFCVKRHKSYLEDLFLTSNGRFLLARICSLSRRFSLQGWNILSKEKVCNISLDGKYCKFFCIKNGMPIYNDHKNDSKIYFGNRTIKFDEHDFQKNCSFLSRCGKYLILVTMTHFFVYNLFTEKFVFKDLLFFKIDFVKNIRINKNGDTLFITSCSALAGKQIAEIKTSKNFQESHQYNRMLQEQEEDDEKERETFVKHDKKNNILNFELKNIVTDEKFQVCKSFLSL